MDEIKDILSALVQYRTIADDFDELARAISYCENLLCETDIVVKRFEKDQKFSLLSGFEISFSPEILFVGHLDVVPANSEEQYTPRIENDRFYARGALDMKGPDAVMVKLMRDLSKENKRGPWALLLTSDEEVGSPAGVMHLVKFLGLSPKFAVIPDGGIGFTVITEGKGVLHCSIRTEGKSAHGSQPWLGDNAILKLLQIYKEIEDWMEEKKEDTPDHWYSTVSLNKIQGGSVVNQVPESAEISLDFRFVPPETPEMFVEKLKGILQKYPESNLKILSTGYTVKTEMNNPYVKKFSKAYKKVIGKEMKTGKEHGATDGRFFAEKNIPVLMVYPEGGGIHGKDEWVSISSLHKLYNLFKAFLLE